MSDCCGQANLLAYYNETLPSELRYDLPQKSIATCKKQTSLKPITGSTFSDTSNSLIQFHVPASNVFVDPKSIFVRFFMASPNCALPRVGAHALFRSVRILSQDNKEICYIPSYNVLVTALSDFTLTPAQRESTAAITDGMGTDAQRASSAWTGGRYYELHLRCGLFGQNRFLPLAEMGGFFLELQLDSPENSMVVTAANPAVNVSDVSLRYVGWQLTDAMSNQIAKYRREHGLRISYTDYAHHGLQYTGANQSLHVSDRSSDIKDIQFVFRNSDILGATVSSVDKLGARAANNITRVQYRIADKYYPDSPLSMDSVGVTFFRELENVHHGMCAVPANSTGWAVSPASTGSFTHPSNGTFLLGYDFESSPTLVSGVECPNKLHQPLEVIISGGSLAGSATSCRVDAFVHYEGILEISPEGNVNVVR